MRIFLILLLLAPHFAQAADSCADLIPASLQTALEKSFPAFRVPQADDNLPEDIAYDTKQGGKGCLGVAIADFDGDGMSDRAVGLTHSYLLAWPDAFSEKDEKLVLSTLSKGKTKGIPRPLATCFAWQITKGTTEMIPNPTVKFAPSSRWDASTDRPSAPR